MDPIVPARPHSRNAIETDYAGHLFRSRLEARWAAMFDMLGWPWTYEPLDLNGYIPDFVLGFRKPLLVEVKPVNLLEEFKQHESKINASGWDGEALIVGASPLMDDEVLGWFGERQEDPPKLFWQQASWLGTGNRGFGLTARTGIYEDRTFRYKDREAYPDGFLGQSSILSMWGEAHRVTRWVPR